MYTLCWIVGSTLVISSCALIGILTLSLKDAFLNKILTRLVALSSGALLGGAFLHLMPEGVELLSPKIFFIIVLSAIVFYLLIEKILHWRHCHKGLVCDTHAPSIGYMNLLGDSVHNFIDGLVIAGAFVVDIKLGLITAVAMGLHEIPQEMGDFGVLLYAGFKKSRALLFNFLAALTTVIGGLVGWTVSQFSTGIEKYLLPLAAGGFIYIAVSDLLPELRKSVGLKKFLVDFIFLLVGIAIIFLASLFGIE
ncbi:MAG: ZIP family metal transporter [Candidatus Magasanikbacteria bacterium CG10_big_fil_rev_8_21_14_0_10_36_32]|uniref:ZIP family metal transporter n=1 Tax=Candidatus Magasanikbacteria bacterium CG10_big_fil_rev_8_21_14_0_10_36_32 TaxID=1974646 RepID=A0A2M6W6X2_9BACT|nr:MAG: ZIP family metal transporter [Candidatus Magasanikbacteria bacterium CG10_big_fil_rev_8_21_14_0_10_36_32]